jgi:hypothetical protein
MPNTLGHLGVQTFLTRSAFKKSDLIWIYIGLLIPDFPWILQRIIKAVLPGADLYDIRLYCVIHASLFFSLVLAASLTLISADFKKVFSLLSLNVLLHLILDSFETKWGNGIQLFVPFNWSIINFGFFWPESIPVYLITAVGLVYILMKWKDALEPSILFRFNKNRIIFSSIILIMYLIIPLFLIGEAEGANNHYIETLRNADQHGGKYFEVDRGTYEKSKEVEKFITPFKKEYKVIGKELSGQGTMSIKAKFLTEDEIEIIDYHFHSAPLRDIPSYMGLLLILIISFMIIKKSLKQTVRSYSGKEIPNSVN